MKLKGYKQDRMLKKYDNTKKGNYLKNNNKKIGVV